MPDNQGQDAYQVFWSQEARASIRTLGEMAQGLGTGERLVHVVKSLDEILRREAGLVGEVCWQRGAIEERLAVREFLACRFAVDKTRNLVLVRDCIALSGHGF